MLRRLALPLSLAMVVSVGLAARGAGKEDCVLDFTVKDIDGKDVKLADYQGKVLLIVNVASKCGLTPQYAGLQDLYEKYKDKGLVVLGFPANEFGAQEPGTNAEIKQFCTSKYDVSFPMFSKIVVKGQGIHPLYQFLTSKETNPEFAGEIGWNFAKFLVGRDGKVIDRFDPRTAPDDAKLVAAVERALAAR
jgi:glutathione peroxidase